MSIFWIISLLIIIIQQPTCGSGVLDEYTQITTNFFINLKHKYDGREGEDSKGKMKEEIQVFRNFVNNERKRHKRQFAYHHVENEMNLLQWENMDIQKFSGLAQSYLIDVENVLDVTMFTQRPAAHDEDQLYMAILQNGEYNATIIIFKYNTKEVKWEQLLNRAIKNPYKVSSITFDGGTLLCVTHRSSHQSRFQEGLTVLLLDDNIRLHFSQTLETPPYNNIALWKTNDQMFLTYSTDHTQSNGKILYETTSPLYVWRGHYFNFLHNIPVSNAKHILHFQIETESFFITANHQNNFGETKIFSSIYKYNSHHNKFIFYQNLATNGAVHVVSFYIRVNNKKDYFITVVNEDGRTQYGIISHTIIYKYENEHFVPFQDFLMNGKTKWYQLKDAADNLALLCVPESNDIKIFQYTGWKFSDVTFSNPTMMGLPNEYGFMKSATLNGKSFIDKNKTSISAYKPVFKTWNNVQSRKASFHSWCEDIKKYISCLHTSQSTLKNVKNNTGILSRREMFSSIVGDKRSVSKLQLSRATVGEIKTKKIIADDVHLDKTVVETLNNLESLFRIQQSSVKFLRENIKNRLQNNNSTHGNMLHIENLQMECANDEPCLFDDVEVEKLNEFNMPEFQKEAFYKESIKDNQYSFVEFDELTVNNSIQFNTINNLFGEQLLLLEFVKHRGLNVQGNVYFPLGLSIDGTVNGVNFSKTTVLLSHSDQIFQENFAMPRINTVSLEARNINDLTKITLEEILSQDNKTYNSKYRTNKLISDEIFIKGQMNNMNADKLFEDSLKLSGNQAINASLTVSSLETVDISGHQSTLLQNIILIDEGEYVIQQDVRFHNLSLNNILIAQRLNDIPVINNEIQVLLLETDKMQRVTGDKVFDFVELMGPFNLQGKINSPSLERKNPVTMIEKPLILTGNVIIDGTVSVEKFLTCDDVNDINMDESIKELQGKALRLSEKHITMPVTFTQPLEVKHLETDMINNISPSSWVGAQSKDFTVITGKKTFLKNLQIRGNCYIHNLNKMDLLNLDTSLLKTYGDQIIYGEMFLNSITVDRIISEYVKLGNEASDDILMANENTEIKGETIINNGAVILQQLLVKSLDITGLISGHNINYILQDTVMLNSYPTHLYGSYKFISPLYVQSLSSNKTFGLNTETSHLTNLWNRHLVLSYLTIDKPVLIKRIAFDSAINGISKRDFVSNWLLKEGNQVIRSKQYFSKVYFTNNVHLQSGMVNNVNIQQLYNNTIWLNDNAYMANVLFNNGLIVKGNMNIGKLFNGLHLPEDFILRTLHRNQNITGHKTFNNINVVGFLNAEVLNDMTIKSLCQFGDYNSMPNLIIEGSLHLQNDNSVDMLHGISVNYLLDHLWLSDTPCYLTGKNNFSYINPQNTLQGNILVANMDLFNLTGKYLSLTKDQEINKNMRISNIVTNVASVGKGTAVSGNVHNINLEDFLHNTMHTTGHQIAKFNYNKITSGEK